jgi:trimethylamine--corrinoid protein Co-methyltransferase
VIKKVGYSGTYLAEAHTAKHFRKNLYMPKVFPREPFEAWKKAGEPMALELAKERMRQILAEHQPREVDPTINKEMEAFLKSVAERDLNDFYAYEQEDMQDYENL